MPELLRVGPYRFHFHSREHWPPHVHVEAGARKAVVWLSPTAVDRNRGYTGRQLKEIHNLVRMHRRHFLRRWYDFFRP